MTQDLLKDGERGRFFRGNLHCHSNRSDGLVEPAEVVAAYREAGYDFLCLSDRAYGAYMLDGLLEGGRKLLVNAGDDAHFGHPLDRFGGWVEVHCDRLDPDALLESLKAGRYYSTQGPHLRELLVDGDRLWVGTSDVYAISLTGGGDRWQSGQERHGEPGAPITEAEFDVAPFRGSYCRITVVDVAGRRAWGNPIWP